MKAEKDKKTGKWLIQFRYTDWQGVRRKTTKRGFTTKREAEEYVRKFLASQQADFNMAFEDFLKLYYEDMEPRLRENTMNNKKYIIDLKILPYFAKRSVSSITAADIRKWQNELISQGYAQTYLRTINNQLTAIFNYAVKYYDLKVNPCRKAGTMGKNKADEMKFWTKEEFSQFADAVMDKHSSYVAFMTLFWTGMRLGEMLALTPADVDFENKTISISKSYQRLYGEDKITLPKTPKSKRIITVPDFLLADIKDYMNAVYGLKSTDRLFQITKYFMEHEMQRGIKNSGVKRIRIHDIRHSHCALLFEIGIAPLEVADRLGHERVETTLNIYAHIYPNKQKKLSDKLEKIYQEGLSSGEEG